MKSKRKEMLSYIRNYRFQSIFFRYLRMMLIGYMVFFCVFSVIVYSMYKNSEKAETTSSIKLNFLDTAQTLRNALLSIDRDRALLNANTSLTDMLALNREELENIDMFLTSVSKACLPLAITTAANGLVDSIYAYSIMSNGVFIPTNFNYKESFYDAKCIDTLQNHPTICIWHDINERNYASVIRVASPINIYNATGYAKNIGTLFINIDCQAIEKLWHYGAKDIQQTSILFSKYGEVLHSNDPSILGYQVNELNQFEPLFELALSNNEVCSNLIDSTLVLAYSFEDYVFMARFLLNSLPFVHGSLYTYFILGIVLGFFLVLFLSMILSLRMYDYILSLIAILQSPTNYANDKQSIAEMRLLRHSIMDVLGHNSHIEVEFARHLKELRNAQTLALQAQINPHFLLNTLQMIYFSTIKEVGRDSASARSILLLSDVVRSNIRTQNYLVELGYEIDQVKKYLQIEELRRGSAIELQLDVEAVLMDTLVVRFMLQPIFENSIIHGFLSIRNDCKIIVSAVSDGQQLILSIKDNGIGMSEEILYEMRKKLESSFLPENTSIGLCNVNMRIRLLLGNEYGLSVYSKTGKGTTVVLTLPMDLCQRL